MSTPGINVNSHSGFSILHYGVSSLFFVLLTVLLFFSSGDLIGHHFQPKLLAITHLAVLGWGVMTIFGASYQFVPVITEAKLYSRKLILISFILLLTGTLLLVYSFWFFKVGWEMQVAGILVFASFICFSINVYLTLNTSKKWGIAADFIQSSTLWLLVTAVMGILMVFNFRYPFLPDSHLVYLKVHAHAGILGWFFLLIIGVASKLLPMFLLSHPPSENWLKRSYWWINLGLLLYIVDTLIFKLSFHMIPIFPIMLGMGYFFYFCQQVIKERVKKEIDWPMKQTLLALILIAIPIFLAILQGSSLSISEPTALRMGIAYGVSIFLGFITALILGQTFKTLPFMVWMYAYKDRNLNTALLPKDLYSEKLVAIMQWVYTPAILVLIWGILIKNLVFINIGAGLFIVVGILYFVNVGKILTHILNPKENGLYYPIFSN